MVLLQVSPCVKFLFTEGAESNAGETHALESDNEAMDEDSGEGDDDTVESIVHKEIRVWDLTMIMSGQRQGEPVAPGERVD